MKQDGDLRDYGLDRNLLSADSFEDAPYSEARER